MHQFYLCSLFTSLSVVFKFLSDFYFQVFLSSAGRQYCLNGVSGLRANKHKIVVTKAAFHPVQVFSSYSSSPDPLRVGGCAHDSYLTELLAISEPENLLIYELYLV